MSNCPKCKAKIKPTYLKQNCPHCGVNMLYYKLDEQLEADAKKASDEVEAVNRFVTMLKNSTIGSPWLIIRLILFFTPLASMCLPMFWAGHKNVSLITFVMSIINHGFDMSAWGKDYLLAVATMVMIIVLSLVEIICSLFTDGKNGTRRNIIAFCINFAVLVILSALTIISGGVAKAGLFVTLFIYLAKLILHLVIGKASGRRIIACAVIIALVPCSILAHTQSTKSDIEYTFEKADSSDISVVSFNVASAFGTSLEDTDSMDRCERFVEYISAVSPDLIGTQELNCYWLDYITKNMTDYTTYGIIRGGDSEDNNSEMNAIIWSSSRFEEIEKNTFWLSETPNEESKYTYTDEEGNPAEAGCNRICSYAVLKDSDDILLFMNTHLDNASEQARTFGVLVILNKIDELKTAYGKDIKIVLTGDFNEYIGDEACQRLASVLNDSTDDSIKKATYQRWGYGNTGDEPIDFIFTTGKSNDYRVLDNLDKGYVSDHYGIYSAINF